MIRKIQIFLAVLALLTAGLACNLPKTTSNPSPAPTVEGSLQTPQTQSNPVTDFSTVKLESSDLPQGFVQISESELAQFGLDVNALLNSISTPLAKAKPENLVIYSKTDGLNTTIIVSFILQPLTLLEKGGFDLLAKNPQKAASIFQNAVTDFKFTPQTDLETIGDSMLDLTFTYSKVNLPLEGDLIASRHKQVVQVVVESGLLGTTPAASAYDAAKIMDGKISEALK